MNHFLSFSRTVNYQMKVFDNSSKPPSSTTKVGEIIVCKKPGSIDQSLWLGIVPCDDICEVDRRTQEYDLSNCDLFAMMSPSPDPSLQSKGQRDVIFLSAPSGSGKSSWVGQYARSWQACYQGGSSPFRPPIQCSQGGSSGNRRGDMGGKSPQRKIVVFSDVEEDRAFEGVRLKRIPFHKLVGGTDPDGNPIDDDEPNNCVEVSSFKDCLVIFDDIDKVTSVKLRKWLQNFRDQFLEVGRHHNVNVICTTHQLMANKMTKTLNMEATKVVIFPSSGSAEQTKRYLKHYIGMSKEQIQKVFSLKSVWVLINKSAPRYVMHANGAYFLT